MPQSIFSVVLVVLPSLPLQSDTVY